MRYLATGIGKQIRCEIRTLCSKRVNSVQRSQNKDEIISFTWTSVIEEARVHYPTLYNVLHLCTVTNGVR